MSTACSNWFWVSVWTTSFWTISDLSLARSQTFWISKCTFFCSFLSIQRSDFDLLPDTPDMFAQMGDNGNGFVIAYMIWLFSSFDSLERFSYGVFVFFGLMTFLGGVFVFFLVPDTKNIPLEAMDGKPGDCFKCTIHSLMASHDQSSGLAVISAGMPTGKLSRCCVNSRDTTLVVILTEMQKRLNTSSPRRRVIEWSVTNMGYGTRVVQQCRIYHRGVNCHSRHESRNAPVETYHNRSSLTLKSHENNQRLCWLRVRFTE